MYLLMTREIQEAVACSRQEPALWVLRNTVAGPGRQRGHEGIGQRVFSGCDVTRARGEQRHEPTVRFARDSFDRVMRRLISSSFQR